MRLGTLGSESKRGAARDFAEDDHLEFMALAVVDWQCTVINTYVYLVMLA